MFIMPMRKIFPIALLSVTFMYLMMCPAVSRISHGYVDKNVIAKEYKKGSSDKRAKRHPVFNLSARLIKEHAPGGCQPAEVLGPFLLVPLKSSATLSFMSTVILLL